MKLAPVSILSIFICLLLYSFASAAQLPEGHELTSSSILKPWTGDLDGMVERRVIHALVAPSRTSY